MSAVDREFAVRYRVGLGNYVAFFGAWIKRTLFDKISRRRLLIYAAILGVLQAGAALQFAIPLFKDLSQPLFWVILAIAFIVVSFFYAAIVVFVLNPLLQFLWHLARYLFSPKAIQTLGLSTDGITKVLQDTETTTAWRDVTDFVETRKTLLLFTARNAAMIVPKSAFASQEDATRFVEAARHHWEMHTASSRQ